MHTMLTDDEREVPENVPRLEKKEPTIVIGTAPSDALMSPNIRKANSWDASLKQFPTNAGVL